MRRIIVLMLLMIFSLVGCGKKDIQSDISESLGIDARKGNVLMDSDSHGGFHGDGMHIPQELRIRSRGTERHSASN